MRAWGFRAIFAVAARTLNTLRMFERRSNSGSGLSAPPMVGDLSLGGVSSLEVLLLDCQVSCRECEGAFAWSRPQSLPQPTGWDEDDFDLAFSSPRAFFSNCGNRKSPWKKNAHVARWARHPLFLAKAVALSTMTSSPR